MPFNLRLGKRSKYKYNVSKDLLVISVELLDHSSIECTLISTSTGQECLADICQRLSLNQPQYFGLLYVSKKSAKLQWLHLEKSVQRQLEKFADSSRLFLRVMYLVPHVDVLQDEVSRSHYYLQLKTQVIDGRLKCDSVEAIKLASYSLQSEFGDFNKERHTIDYLSNFVLLPRTLASSKQVRDILLESVISAYRLLEGVPPNFAEQSYISLAQELNGYGQEGFSAKSLDNGSEVCLGVSLKGVFAVGSQEMEQFFGWTEIANLIHHKKVLSVELNLEGRRKNFIFEGDYAQFAWKVFVNQHQISCKFTEKPTESREKALVAETTSAATKPIGAPPGGQPVSHGNGSESQAEGQVFLTSSFSPNNSQDHLASSHLIEHQRRLNAGEPVDLQQPHFPLANQPVHCSLIDPLTGLALSDPSLGQGNVTTVQVHHEPPWALGSVEQELLSPEERRALLPPYKLPPDYETFIRVKYGIHSISVGNLPSYTSGTQGNLPPFNSSSTYGSGNGNGMMPAPGNSNGSKSGPSVPYFVPQPSYSQYKNYSDLSTLELDLGSKQCLPPNTSQRMVVQPPSHGLVSLWSQGSSEAVIAPHFITNSTPELNSVNVYNRKVTEQYKNQQESAQSLATSYRSPPPYAFNSVPDLTEQNILQQQVARNSLDIENRLHGIALVSPVLQFSCRDVLRFPGGSEPNLPKVLSVSQLNNHSSSRGSASRHLSIDTLNMMHYPLNMSRNEKLEVAPASGGAAHHMKEQQIQQIYTLTENSIHSQPSFHEQQHHQSLASGAAQQVHHLVKMYPATACGVSVSSSANQPVLPMDGVTSNGNGNGHHCSGGDVRSNSSLCGITSISEGVLSTSISSTSSAKDPRIAALEGRLTDSEFMREFDLLPRMNPMAKFTTALLPENSFRNRFRDILPYEDNRVRLAPTKENRAGYINASNVVMNVGRFQQRYIAAQGPLANTVADFWNMVWSNECTLIVMVTELTEGGQEKCFEYFPLTNDSGQNILRFGDYEVRCNFTIVSTTYVSSSLSVSFGGASRTIWHIRYTDWPDHTCPEDLQGFLSFLEGIDAIHRLSAREGSGIGKKKTGCGSAVPPMVVHCSAGVGRSGVVILCDALLRSLDYSSELDVPKSLTQLRFQRMLSVQNFGQYRFVYHVLAQYLRNSRLI